MSGKPVPAEVLQGIQDGAACGSQVAELFLVKGYMKMDSPCAAGRVRIFVCERRFQVMIAERFSAGQPCHDLVQVNRVSKSSEMIELPVADAGIACKFNV